MTKISIENLRAIMPRLSYSKATQLINPLNSALVEFEINTRLRIAAFLAQLAVESAELTVWEENLNYSASGLLKIFKKYFTAKQAAQYAKQPQKIANRVYANRGGNGNESSGDGWKYRGRGPIQITFADNYTKYGSMIGINLLENPDLALRPDVGFRLAGAYWKLNTLNVLADKGDIVGITKRINDGITGLAERQAFYAKAKTVLAPIDSEPPSSVSSIFANTNSSGSASIPSNQSSAETQPKQINEQIKSEKLPTDSSVDAIKLPKVSPSLKSQVVGYWHQLLGAGITLGGLVEFAHDHVTLVICVIVGLTVIGFGLWYLNRSMNRAAEQTKKNQDIVASVDLNNVVVTGKE